MFSITMSEALNTLAAFSEVFSVRDFLNGIIFSPTAGDKYFQEKDGTSLLLPDSSKCNSRDTNEICSVTESVGNMVLMESSKDSNCMSHENSNCSQNTICLSRDRLVETIEDKIQQREFELGELSAHGSSKDLPLSSECLSLKHSNKICEPLSKTIDSSDDLLDQVSSCMENADIISYKTELETDNTSPIGNEKNVCVLERETKTNECYSASSSPPKEQDLYVSTVECVLKSTTSELSLNETESASQDEELQRTKKNVTYTWDPVPLMNYLYHMEEQIDSKDEQELMKKLEGLVDVQNFGTFIGREGCYYLVLSANFLYFFESAKKEKLILKICLKYASVECIDKDVILLDNKIGKCVRFKYSSEHELQSWKKNLITHCVSLSKCNALMPVNYPLKSSKNVIIIDLGSCSTRAGILMDQPTLPKLFFPTVCATEKKSMKRYYGVDALLPEVRQNSVLSFPVRQSAKITKFTMDIEALKGLFEKIFHDLNVDQQKFTVQLCIPRSLSTSTQVALVKMLIEELGVQAVSLTMQALLTLYANNTSSAIVVDIGERMDVMPVVDGFILEGGVSKLPYGGQQIIHHMKHALAQKHISLSNDVESFIVRYIAESLCYVAENYDEELNNAMQITEPIKKSLPLYPFFKDESKLQTVTLDIGRFQVPEGLFNPDLWGLDFPGLHKLVHHAIQSSGMDVRRLMAENIYVSGGVTLIPGFVERLENEIAKLTLPRLKPQVHASPYRYHMAYLGACQLAASEAFQQVCINSKEWQAKGPSCLRKWHL